MHRKKEERVKIYIFWNN